MRKILIELALASMIAALAGMMAATIITAQRCSKDHTLCERR